MQVDSRFSVIFCHKGLAADVMSCFRNACVACRYDGECMVSSDCDIGTALALLAEVESLEVMRYLDQYLLAFPIGLETRQAVIDNFFSSVACRYNNVVDVHRNMDNINNLAMSLSSFGLGKSSKIIDYGCGTGLSSYLQSVYSWNILGVDRCSDMRFLSKSNGLEAVPPRQLTESHLGLFDGAFSSYVFHLVYDYSDIVFLWSALRVGGVVVANFHKGFGDDRITPLLCELGASVHSLRIPQGVYNHGLYRMFLKDGK